MKSARHSILFALSLLLLPVVCSAQAPAGSAGPAQPNRGTSTAPRRGGAAESPESRGAGQRRSARGVMKSVQLPAPSMSSSITVEAALTRIQSLTIPSDQQLKLSDLGQLAWAAQGRPTSAVPSGGLTTDERMLMKVHFVLPDGLYLYVPSSHSLEETRDGDHRASLSTGLLNQQSAPVGGCQIVVSGALKDFSTRYGARARNVMLILAGQMVQSIQLEAAALNLTFVGINNVDVATARRICAFSRDIDPLYVIVVGYAPTAPAGNSPAAPAGGSSKVVIITPQNGFQDEEFFETKRGLELNSVQVVVASMRPGPIRSMGNRMAQADMAITDVHAANFNAIILIGGVGTMELTKTRPLWDLIREAAAQRKVMAASGNAPAILAAATVLKGSRVTGAAEIQPMLVTAGATFTGRTVEKDGPLVTSIGPGAIPLFVQAILDEIAGT
jgi:protease I